jgi:hypothetical protein
MAQPAPQFDLFVNAAIEEARENVRLANDARDQADHKVRCAPHGTYRARLKAFADATHDLLKAEGQLARLLREAGL